MESCPNSAADAISARSNSTDLADDDFELVSPSSYRGDGTDIDDSPVASSRMEAAVVNGIAGDEMQPLLDGSLPAIDPRETFVLIQKEHEALRSELEGQTSLLTSGLAAMKEFKERKNQEVGELKNNLTELRSELENSRDENQFLKTQLKSFNECRDKVDELTAKLCQAEDVSKYHEQVIRQFQAEGFVSVQPPMLTDAMLAKELSDKENHLKAMQEKTTELESALLKEKEQALKCEKDNEELRGLVMALQEQVTEDRAYLNEVRSAYEDQLRVLRDELARLGSTNPSSVHYTDNQQTLTQESVASTNAENAAGYPSAPLQAATEGGEGVLSCEKCGIRVCDAVLFMRHTESCRPSIDHID